MNIYEKLQNCRVELQNLKLKKSGKNSYSGFDYFELKDFLPVVNELFDKYKLFSNFSINLEGLAILEIIDTDWIEATVKKDESKEFFNQNEPAYKIQFTSPVAELELKGCNKIQALGGVHTYMKRYLYLNALEIVEADMFDSTSGKDELKEPSKDNKDEQIISEMNKIDNLSDLNKFYAENKDNVCDRNALNKLYANRAKELRAK